MKKSELTAALKGKTVREAAEVLGVSPSTVYRRAKKLGVTIRSKSEAQKRHLKKNTHQRVGAKHSTESRRKIAGGSSEYWDSPEGQKTRKKVAKKKKAAWKKKGPRARAQVIEAMHKAPRPKRGELSQFAQKVRDIFVEKGHNISECVPTLPRHITDLVLTVGEKKIAIEAVGSMNYGGVSSDEFNTHYEKLAQRLEGKGFQVVFLIDMGKYMSRKRTLSLYRRAKKQLEGQTTSFMLRS